MNMCIRRIIVTLMILLAIAGEMANASDTRSDCIQSAAGWYQGRLFMPYVDMDPESASASCEEAVQQNPNDPLMKALYCRALLKKNLPMLALEYCLSAATEHDTTAMNVLGYLYSSDYQDVLENDTAFEWYERSAQAGDAIGQYHTGRFLLGGIHKHKDVNAAIRWLQAAAKQYQPDAMLLLAMAQADEVGDVQTGKNVDIAFTRYAATYGTAHPNTLQAIKDYTDWLIARKIPARAIGFVDTWMNRIGANDDRGVAAKIFLQTLKGDFSSGDGHSELALEAYRDALAMSDAIYIEGHPQEWLALVEKTLSLLRKEGTEHQILSVSLDILQLLPQDIEELSDIRRTVCRWTKHSASTGKYDWLSHCKRYFRDNELAE